MWSDNGSEGRPKSARPVVDLANEREGFGLDGCVGARPVDGWGEDRVENVPGSHERIMKSSRVGEEPGLGRRRRRSLVDACQGFPAQV